MDHEAIKELLAVYALTAVESHESDLVESHAAQCPECRTELDQHLEVAALLPSSPQFAPATIWDSIAGAIGTEPATVPEQASPVPLPRNVEPRRRRWARPLAAAIFAVVAGTAIVQSVRVGQISDDLVAQRETVASLSQQIERPVLQTAVSQALGDPAAQRVMLGSQSSGSNAIIVLMPDGTGYLAEHTLQPLPADRTYQLWAIVDGRVISAGVLGSKPGVVPFHIDPKGFEGFAITEEVIGGVATSENAPVVAWLAA